MHVRKLFIFCLWSFLRWHHLFMNTSVTELFVFIRKNKLTTNLPVNDGTALVKRKRHQLQFIITLGLPYTYSGTMELNLNNFDRSEGNCTHMMVRCILWRQLAEALSLLLKFSWMFVTLMAVLPERRRVRQGSRDASGLRPHMSGTDRDYLKYLGRVRAVRTGWA